MRTPSNPTPGTLAIVLQGALLTGILCGVAAGFYKSRQPVVSPQSAAVPVTPAPENEAAQKEAVTLSSARFDSQTGKYWVEVEDFQGDNTGFADDTRNASLRLLHGKTGKTLWKTSVFCVSNTKVYWSEDGRAVAVFDNVGIPNRLLLWREGERLREIKGGDALDCEGVFELLWSPDKQGILLRTALAMGSYDSNLGDLWYIHFRSKRKRELAKGEGVRQMEWLSNRRVRYKTVTYETSTDGEYLFERFHTQEQTLR